MIRMKKDAATAAVWQVFVCDGCGREIADRREVYLLREADAIPEDLTVRHVHRACADAFQTEDRPPPQRYPLSAPEAAWFLPVLGPEPPQELPAVRPLVVRKPLGGRRVPDWIPAAEPLRRETRDTATLAD